MTRSHDLENLLRDVLREGEPDGFRSELDRKCRLELARKRTGWGLWVLPAAAAVLFAFLVALGRPVEDPPPVIPTAVPKEPAYVVHTSPLSREGIVATAAADVTTVRTASASVLVVLTPADAGVEVVNDREVLDMFPGAPCGVVQDWLGDKSLVFLKPQDREKYLGGR
jgi:hypothetical protein